jgi:hypothetical protein
MAMCAVWEKERSAITPLIPGTTGAVLGSEWLMDASGVGRLHDKSLQYHHIDWWK